MIEIISRINSIIQGERYLNEVTSNIEVVSFFILVRYAEIYNQRNISDFHHFTEWRYLDSYFNDCRQILYETFNAESNIFSYDNAYEKLFSHIPSFFTKINSYNFIYQINLILSEIKELEDFLYLADDYRSMIQTMALESPQLGEFYTPVAVAQLMANMVNPEHGYLVYDPSCGSSGFLLEVSKYIKNNKPDLKYKLIGSDISLLANIMSFVSLLLNGEKNFHLNLGNSLNQKNLNKYDIILANPPFGKIKYRNEIPVEHELQYIDYYFLKNIMDCLCDNGQAVVILPERFLHDSNKYCMELKNELFHNYNVQEIISIPPGSMLPATGVKVIILHFIKSAPSKKTWIYLLNSVDRFYRKNPIENIHFNDLLSKIGNHIDSDNSWSVSLDALGENYHSMFERNINKNFIKDLKMPFEYVSIISDHHKSLKSSLDIVSNKIEKISIKISSITKNYEAVSFKLEDLVESMSTKPLSKINLFENGEFRVYGGNGVIGYYNSYMHSGEFIVIGRVGAYCGNVKYVEGNIWVTNNAIILKCTRLDIVYPSYLAKILERKVLRNLATGTAQPHLTVSKIKNIDIYLPPVAVQVEVDGWLNQLDSEIELQQKIVKEIIKVQVDLRDSLYQTLLWS